MINISISLSANEINVLTDYVMKDLTKEEQEIVRKVFNKFIDKLTKDFESIKSLKLPDPLKSHDLEF